MKKLEIYEYQAKQIEDTLRIASNVMKSKDKKTSLDRDIMQSLEMIRLVLSNNIDTLAKR